MPNINKVVEKIPAFTGMMIDECFLMNRNAACGWKWKSFIPLQSGIKIATNSRKHAQKINGSARMPTINKKRKMFRGDTNHGRN
jgi:hypothetical protein